MRRKDREITDIRRIREILDETLYLHAGLLDGDYPYVLAYHYGYTYEEKENVLIFYAHCAKEGHALDLIRQNPRCFIQLENEVEPAPGGDVACRYGSYYASVMGRGTAEILPPGAEKNHALEVLMKHQTGRDFAITDAMAGTVNVIKFTVQDFTAKAREKK